MDLARRSQSECDADWRVLLDAGVLTGQEVAAMKKFGGDIGYRVGIADDGTWCSASPATRSKNDWLWFPPQTKILTARGGNHGRSR